MATAFDRYGEALGLWRLPLEKEDDEPIELTLKMGDGKQLRDILMNDTIRKDKNLLFRKFEEFMFRIIKRDYPTVDDNSIKAYIEINSMILFEEAQITFRYTTRGEFAKAKEDFVKDLKKSIGEA